jgi:hypothetical protein
MEKVERILTRILMSVGECFDEHVEWELNRMATQLTQPLTEVIFFLNLPLLEKVLFSPFVFGANSSSSFLPKWQFWRIYFLAESQESSEYFRMTALQTLKSSLKHATLLQEKHMKIPEGSWPSVAAKEKVAQLLQAHSQMVKELWNATVASAEQRKSIKLVELSTELLTSMWTFWQDCCDESIKIRTLEALISNFSIFSSEKIIVAGTKITSHPPLFLSIRFLFSISSAQKLRRRTWEKQ